jgi:hypothetical protein
LGEATVSRYCGEIGRSAQQLLQPAIWASFVALPFSVTAGAYAKSR